MGSDYGLTPPRAQGRSLPSVKRCCAVHETPPCGHGRGEPLTLPDTLDRDHARLLREHLFEDAGPLWRVLTTDAWDGLRIVYALTDPECRAVVYVGETELGRNLRGRLRCHLRDREKLGAVERESRVYVHVMITEFMVLARFREETDALPRCNKRMVAKFATRRPDGCIVHGQGCECAAALKPRRAPRCRTQGDAGSGGRIPRRTAPHRSAPSKRSRCPAPTQSSSSDRSGG